MLMAAIAAIPAFHSCAEKEPVAPVEQTEYTYRFELADSETRATLGEEGVFWESGDQVGVFMGSAASVAAIVNMSSTPKTIDLSTETPLAEGTAIHAYYPFQGSNTDVTAVDVVFPSTQQGGSVSAMPMAGVPTEFHEGATNGSIFFLNLGSILDFRVFSSTLYHGEQIQSITFSASAGGYLSGVATLDLTNVSRTGDGPQVPDLGWSNGKTSVTLKPQAATVAESKDAAAVDHLYMVIAPGTYSGAFEVVTNVATYSFSISNITFNRNGLKRVNLDLEKESAMRGGVFSIENDKMKAYLDKVDANPYNPPTDYDMTHMTEDIYGGNQSTTNRTDWPKPVPVSWTNPTSGNTTKVVYVYNDAAMTDLELSVSVSNKSVTSADVYNLIPNRTYYYKVINGDSTVPVTKGVFSTTGRRRMINVGNSQYGKMYANNCRDFGGQVTQDGRMIKYGKLFRGSNMDKTTDAQKQVLLNYMHIGLDVDLRYGYYGTAGAGENRLYDALHLGTEWHTSRSFNSWSDLTNTEKMEQILSKVFSAVELNKGVYIHCMVGADRTGYVCMLLEAILGVEQGWCDVDYELTSLSGAVDSGKPRIRTGSPVNYYYRTVDNELRGVDFIYSLSGGSYGNTFQAKAVNYVVNTLGVPYEKVQAFQNNMLENLN